MYTCNGKKVLGLRYNANIEDKAALSNIWEDFGYRGSNVSIFLKSAADIAKIVKVAKGSLQAKQTLFFGKTSKFPRFKLSESDFKRCIKIEKADTVVVGDLDFTQDNVDNVLEDEEYIYIIDNWRAKNYVRCRDSRKKAAWDQDCVKYIKDNDLFYGSSIEKIYSGTISIASKEVAFDLENILNGIYKNVITDKELDTAINKNFDSLDVEDLTAICDMLDSSDRTTQGLGLKMLCGYNINDVVLTVRTMLGTRPHLSSCSEWTSVGVQQVLKTIKWRGFGNFPLNMYNVVQPGDNSQVYSEHDKSLCREVYMIAAKQYMDNAINTLNNTGILSTFGVNVTYEIK